MELSERMNSRACSGGTAPGSCEHWRISWWIVGTDEYQVGRGLAVSHSVRKRVGLIAGPAMQEAPESSEASRLIEMPWMWYSL